MKIAFIGDSYCADWGPDSYLDIVLRHFNNAELICTGLKGMALFHSYETLFNARIEGLDEMGKILDSQRGVPVIDEADYIVFCITSADRLATRHTMPCMLNLMDYYLDPAQDVELDAFLEHYLLAPYPVKGKGKEKGRKILQTVKNFYEDLYDISYFKHIQIGLLMQIDQLMLQKKKKCIWFTCVDHLWTKKNWPEYYPHFTPKSGPYGNVALCDISMSEEHASETEQLQITKDVRYNHLNEENNLRLANLIINIIDSNDFTPKEINMKDHFEILK